MRYPILTYDILRKVVQHGMEDPRADTTAIDLYLSMMETKDIVRAICNVPLVDEAGRMSAIRAIVNDIDLPMDHGLAAVFGAVNDLRGAGHRVRLPIHVLDTPRVPGYLANRPNVETLIWWQAQEGMAAEVYGDDQVYVSWVELTQEDREHPLAAGVSGTTTGYFIVASKTRTNDIMMMPTGVDGELKSAERLLGLVDRMRKS